MRLALLTAVCAACLVGLWPSAPTPTYQYLDKRPLSLAPADKWTFRESCDHLGDQAIRILQTGETETTQYWEVQYYSPERWTIVRYQVRLGMVINKDIILKEYI